MTWAELVGRRVALRHRIGTRSGRPLHTDAVGELSIDGDVLVVQTRRGPVRVAPEAVVAVRAVPPPVPKRASWAAVARLEELCADAWPAVVDEPLGAWRLRAAGGFTSRANSALAVGDPGVRIADALDVVVTFSARHAIPPRVLVPVGSRWDRAITAEGWVPAADHDAGAEVAVLVADVTVLAGPAHRPGPGVTLADRPEADWWRLALAHDPTPAERHVLDPAGSPRTAFGLARGPNGTPVGRIRACLVEDHVHLSMLAVVPEARRRGIATALTRAAASWGRMHGARWAVLQVAQHDTAARALYDGLGCTEHHRYRYFRPAEPG